MRINRDYRTYLGAFGGVSSFGKSGCKMKYFSKMLNEEIKISSLLATNEKLEKNA